MEYRTNVYRDESQSTPGANARISPGLGVAAQGADHEFTLGGDWDIRRFFYLGDVPTLDGGTVEAGQRLDNLSRYNDFNIAAGTELFKRSSVGFVLTDRVSLRNNATDAEFADAPFTTQFRNVLAGGLRISPTSALSFVPGGSWAYDDYRVAAIAGERYNARFTYGPKLEVRWEFFPRTALVLNSSYLLYRWGENVVDVADDVAGVALPNSQHFRTTLGLEGQLTARLLLNLSAGYGFATYDEGTTDLAGVAAGAAGAATDIGQDLGGLDGLLAKVQLRYLLQENAELFAGFQRDFTDSFFTNYILYNYVYTGGALQIGDLRPEVRYGIRLEDYAGAIARKDNFHRLNLNLQYDLQDWAALRGGAAMQARLSEDAEVEYQDWNLNLSALFTY